MTTQTIPTLKTEHILAKYPSNIVDVIGLQLYDDNSLTTANKPFIKTIGGESVMKISHIHNNGADLNINGYIFSGGGPPSPDVNKENISVLNINKYTGIDPLNEFINLKNKTVMYDNIRFVGIGTDINIGKNQTVISEYEYSPGLYELGLFKGKGVNNRIRLDAENSIVFQTDNSSQRLFPSNGITRMTIDNTKVDIVLPLQVDTINEHTLNAGVTIDILTLVKDGNITTSGYVQGSQIKTDSIVEKTLNAGTTIGGVLLKNNNIQLAGNISVDDIIEKTLGHGIVISGVTMFGSGNMLVPGTFSMTTTKTDTINELSVGHGVIVDGLTIKDTGITNAVNITTTNLNVSNINTTGPVTIEGISFDSTWITTTGEIEGSVLKGLTINTDTIYETTLNNGIFIDGVHMKDGVVTASNFVVTGSGDHFSDLWVNTIHEQVTGNGVTIEGANIKNSTLTVNQINCSNIPGLNVKTSCVVATTGNITLSGLQTIDNVSLTADQRVLVWQQGDQKENGIYAVASGPWTRTVDADSTIKLHSAYTAVSSGDTYKDTLFYQITDSPVVGVSNIVWIQMTGGGGATIHNNLSGLQGGTTSQYYHMTSAQYTAYNAWFPNVTLASNGNTTVPILISAEHRNTGNVTINAINASADSTVYVTNSDLTYKANLDIKGKLITDFIEGKASANELKIMNDITWKNEISGSNLVSMNIPTGNKYDFKIGGVTKLSILESSIATDHVFGINRETGPTMVNGLRISSDTDIDEPFVTMTKEMTEFQTENISKLGSSSWLVSSDTRIKKNVSDSDIDKSWKLITSIPIKNYEYNSDYMKTDKKFIGIIAQELEEVYNKIYDTKVFDTPIVTQKKKKVGKSLYKDFKDFDSGRIIFHLINCIKYLNKKIVDKVD